MTTPQAAGNILNYTTSLPGGASRNPTMETSRRAALPKAFHHWDKEQSSRKKQKRKIRGQSLSCFLVSLGRKERKLEQ